MRIAVDCRLFRLPDAEEMYSTEAFVRSLLEHREKDEFFLVFDQPPPASWRSIPHAKSIVLKPAAQSAATRVLWYDLRLPALLSGHQIDLFIGTAGYISLRTPVKQVLLFNDVLSGQSFPSVTGWNGSWYKRRLSAMLQKSSHRFLPAMAQVHELGQNSSNLSFEKLPFCPLKIEAVIPSDDEKSLLKKKYSGGCEYFFCEDGWNNTDDAVELLLAFSAFKKRMLTGMKLLLAGKGPDDRIWKEKLATYRYREDVVILPEHLGSDERTCILSAAYALIHLPVAPKIPLLQKSLCLGVPVITWPHEVFRELAGDAVLYCTELAGEAPAQNLMRIYKDEKMRAECIKKGLLRSANWHNQIAVQTFCKIAFGAKD